MSLIKTKKIEITSIEKLNIVEQFLKEKSIPFREDYSLKNITYFKMGGNTKLFIEPNQLEQLTSLIEFLLKQCIVFKVIGLTSNLYILDELDYSIIISTQNLKSLTVSGSFLNVECGYQLKDFVRVALINGLVGFEGLEGIPATLGGAIFMNAGAYGYSISDKLVSVVYVDEQGVNEISKKECEFKHRTSFFKNNHNKVILSASFKSSIGDKKRISKKITKYHIARHSYQEFAFPNIGSMFSISGDFYREFFRDVWLYKKYLLLLKVILKNPISKFFFRKNPNNKIFNWLVCRYIFPSKLPLEISEKSMNILINDGSISFKHAKEHIESIQNHLNTDTPLENEVVLGPLINSKRNENFIISIKNGDIE